MTTPREIITAAYREINVLPLGGTASTAQVTEGLDRLNRFIRAVYGYEIGENMANWPVPSPQRTAPVAANYPQLPYPVSLNGNLLLPQGNDETSDVFHYPPQNSRIVWAGRGAAVTIYFPEQPNDGARMGLVRGSTSDDTSILTLDGNGYSIETASTVSQPAVVTPKRWFFRADQGDWRLITDITNDVSGLDGTMPFPDDFDHLWIGLLAIRIAPAYNKSVSPETQEVTREALKRIKARYRQSNPTIYGSFNTPNSRQSFGQSVWMV
jgi:hypothetical protein